MDLGSSRWEHTNTAVPNLLGLKKIKSTSLQALKPSSGWARPIYINRHPHPPAKYIRFSGISKVTKCYRMLLKIIVDGSRDLGYSGIWSSFDDFPLIKFAKSYTGPGRQLRTSANNGRKK